MLPNTHLMILSIIVGLYKYLEYFKWTEIRAITTLYTMTQKLSY